jgi:hypothetical protein
MDVLPGNRRVLAMIVAHWPQAAVGHALDSVDIRIPLPQPELPQPDPRPRAARPPTGPLVQPAAVAAGKALAAVGR